MWLKHSANDFFENVSSSHRVTASGITVPDILLHSAGVILFRLDVKNISSECSNGEEEGQEDKSLQGILEGAPASIRRPYTAVVAVISFSCEDECRQPPGGVSSCIQACDGSRLTYK